MQTQTKLIVTEMDMEMFVLWQKLFQFFEAI